MAAVNDAAHERGNETARARTLRQQLAAVCSAIPLLQAWPKRLAGVPITYDQHGVVSYALEGHRLILGDPGEGKGTSVFMPMLLHDVRGANGRRAGMIVVDPKDAELVRLSRPVRTLFGSPVYTLDPFGLAGDTDGCNPLDRLRPEDIDFFARCAGLARATVGESDETGHDGVRWQQRARELMTGMIGHLASDPEEEKSFARLRALIRATAPEFEACCRRMMASGAAFVRSTGSELLRLLEKAPKEFQGYMSVMSQHTEFVDDPRLARVVARSTFDWSHVRDSGATVYITLPDADLGMAAPWLRLMVEVGLQATRYAHLPPARRAAACDVHLLIDEAKAFGPWRMIEDGLRALRSERIALHLAYQNLAQIRAVWREGYTRITAVKMIQFLGSNDTETCEWIAKLAGETTVVDRSHAITSGATQSVTYSENSGASETSQEGWSETKGQSQAVGATRGTSMALGASESSGVARSRAWGKASSWGSGWSHATGTSSQSGFAGGAGGGSSSTNNGSSSTTTYSTNKSESTSENSSVGTTSNTGRTVTRTANEGVSETTTTQEGEGRSGSTSTARSTGESRAVGNTEQDGTSTTHTERRRLLTVQEVRALPRDQAVVFVERAAGVVVQKLHFHRNPALLLRILDAKLARR